jgi:predicted Zn finger-like uncharacterized protein
MLIVCPSCATSYDIGAESLQPNGRKVRCVRCRTVWHAQPSQSDMLLAAARALAPEREMADAASSQDAAGPSDAGWGDPADHQSFDDQPQGSEAASPADIRGGFEVQAPPIAPVDLDEGRPPISFNADEADEQGPEDIETYAARHGSEKAKGWSPRWPLSRMQSVILILVIINSIVIGWRTDFVRAMPQTASFYGLMGLSVSLRGLEFEDVTTTTEQHEGVPILVVEGTVVNKSRRIVDVPRLKFAVRNTAREEIYSWTAVSPRAALPPGESVAFRARLASPPPDGRDVLVRFLNRRDIIAGAH